MRLPAVRGLCPALVVFACCRWALPEAAAASASALLTAATGTTSNLAPVTNITINSRDTGGGPVSLLQASLSVSRGAGVEASGHVDADVLGDVGTKKEGTLGIGPPPPSMVLTLPAALSALIGLGFGTTILVLLWQWFFKLDQATVSCGRKFAEELEFSKMLGVFSRCVVETRWTVLVLAVATSAVGVFGVPGIFGATETEFSPTPGMESYNARVRFEDLFPGTVRAADFFALVEVPSSAEVLDVPGLREFSFELRQQLNSSHPLASFISNATLWFESGVPSGSLLLGNQGSTTLFYWRIAEGSTSEAALQFADEAVEAFGWLMKRVPGISFGGVAGAAIATKAAVDAG